MLFSVLIVFIVCAVPFQVIKIYYLYTQGNRGYKVGDFISSVSVLSMTNKDP